MRESRNFIRFLLCSVTLVGFTMTNCKDAYCTDGPLYLGEYCWDTTVGGSYRVGITLTGDGHFTLSGIAEGPGREWAIHGNLEVVGDSIKGTFVDALMYDGGMSMESRVGHASLDLSTLNGVSNLMWMRWEGGVCNVFHGTDVLNYVSCEKTPSPDGGDERKELIRMFKKYSSAPREIIE